MYAVEQHQQLTELRPRLAMHVEASVLARAPLFYSLLNVAGGDI